MSKKGVIVVDTNDSALANSAYARFKSEDFEIIPALDFNSLGHLLHYLISLQPTTIHFAWREVMHNLLVTQKKSKLKLMFSFSQVGFGVADYLGLTKKLRGLDSYLILVSDYFTVVNEDLAYQYFATFKLPEIPVVFHDFPDIESLNAVRAADMQRNLDFVWVGNSKWGENYGFQDYKGYKQYVRPLTSNLGSELDNLSYEIIDSANQRLSHLETLKTISTSRTLILSSKQEGTGLPVLEALALGTLPICRKVGVLPELLRHAPDLPIFDGVEELREILSRNLRSPILSPDLSRLVFNRYMESILLEQLPEPHAKKTERVIRSFSFYMKFRTNLIWQLRRFKRGKWRQK